MTEPMAPAHRRIVAIALFLILAAQVLAQDESEVGGTISVDSRDIVFTQAAYHPETEISESTGEGFHTIYLATDEYDFSRKLGDQRSADFSIVAIYWPTRTTEFSETTVDNYKALFVHDGENGSDLRGVGPLQFQIQDSRLHLEAVGRLYVNVIELADELTEISYSGPIIEYPLDTWR